MILRLMIIVMILFSITFAAVHNDTTVNNSAIEELFKWGGKRDHAASCVQSGCCFYDIGAFGVSIIPATIGGVANAVLVSRYSNSENLFSPTLISSMILYGFTFNRILYRYHTEEISSYILGGVNFSNYSGYDFNIGYSTELRFEDRLWKYFSLGLSIKFDYTVATLQNIQSRDNLYISTGDLNYEGYSLSFPIYSKIILPPVYKIQIYTLLLTELKIGSDEFEFSQKSRKFSPVKNLNYNGRAFGKDSDFPALSFGLGAEYNRFIIELLARQELFKLNKNGDDNFTVSIQSLMINIGYRIK